MHLDGDGAQLWALEDGVHAAPEEVLVWPDHRRKADLAEGIARDLERAAGHQHIDVAQRPRPRFSVQGVQQRRALQQQYRRTHRRETRIDLLEQRPDDPIAHAIADGPQLEALAHIRRHTLGERREQDLEKRRDAVRLRRPLEDPPVAGLHGVSRRRWRASQFGAQEGDEDICGRPL